MESFILKRLIAQVIDAVVYYFVTFFLLSFLSGCLLGILIPRIKTYSTFSAITVGIVVMELVLAVVLLVWLNYRSIKKDGTTIGYSFMGLKIVNADGSKLNERESLKRAAARLLAPIAVFTIIGGLIHLAMVFDSKGEQGLIDKFMGTKAKISN